MTHSRPRTRNQSAADTIAITSNAPATAVPEPSTSPRPIPSLISDVPEQRRWESDHKPEPNRALPEASATRVFGELLGGPGAQLVPLLQGDRPGGVSAWRGCGTLADDRTE